MKKSKLEAIVETLEGIAFDSLSALENLRDKLNIIIEFGSED